MEIRSYRRVFDLERRIYRVDRLRLNPGGVPVRGIVYFLALLAAVLLAARLPLIGELARAVPWYLRYLALPGLAATLLGLVRVEGRPFHLAVRAVLRAAPGSRRLVGFEVHGRGTGHTLGQLWRPRPLLMLPDGSEGRLRRLNYRGPGALLIAVAHERKLRRGPLVAVGLRAHLSVKQIGRAERPPGGEVIVLERAGRLSVR
ncbi:MAG TPA: hypothetical protein VHW67_02540 [Solirubrobacteraceae bacterium]|jgi:hypothetical protein|nr:hypothetical protein [Solirubrobacteraceae bacterium]